MTWQTNPAVITSRNIARKAGLNRVIERLRPNRGYEFNFDDQIFSHLREGDVAWDIGANVSYYTKRFGDILVPLGMMFAFEPLPGTVARLRENLVGRNNYALVLVALGAGSGSVAMQSDGDALGATNRIVDDVRNGGVTTQIETTWVDSSHIAAVRD